MPGRKLFHVLRDPDEVIREARERLPRGLRKSRVSLYEAVYHILAEDVEARDTYPPEPRATADGYAVNHECVRSASEERPVRLPVVERVRVGEVPSSAIEGCVAVEVDTGAVVPKGADAVVPVEYTREEAGVVEVYRSVGFGDNIAWPGSDVVEGEVVARRGSLLTPQLIGALAASGIEHVVVYEKPRVCVAATGSELVPPGERLSPGKIHESNTYTLRSLLALDGFPATIAGILPDDVEAIRSKLRECLRDHDVMIFTGGTSAGPYDIVYRVLEEEGELIAHGLKLKPGKPTAVAIVDGKLVLGLPGNPVSALNSYRVVARPLLWHLAGGEPPAPGGVIRARLALPAAGVRGRRLYQPVYLVEGRGDIYAVPIEFESYMIVTYSRSDGYIIIPEDVHEALPEGTEVEVHVENVGWRTPAYCIGEELRGYHCKPVWGGTSLASKLLSERIPGAVYILSEKHPAFREPGEGFTVERVKRRLAVAVRGEPKIVALPPPSTSLRFLLLERIGGYRYAVPAKSSLMAAYLYSRGYVDAAVMLLEDAERMGIEPGEVIEEELIVARVSPGGGSSQP